MTTGYDLNWWAWEQREMQLDWLVVQQFHDLLFQFNLRGTAEEKAALLAAHPIYARASCIPFWAAPNRNMRDPRITLFLERLGPSGRQALGDLRATLIIALAKK